MKNIYGNILFVLLTKVDMFSLLVFKQYSVFSLSAYRNWMNSMGVSPHVNRLYSDLQDGLILFQLYDIIQPGCVDWKRVQKQFKKMKATFEKIGN